MKNKKVVALLVVLALIQLVFPLSFMAYEKLSMDAVIQKGASYTLDYTKFNHFDKQTINLNTDDIYTVGYKWDGNDYGMGEHYIPYDTVSVFRAVGIRKDEKGEIEFFDAESCDKALLKKDNWFNVNSTFHIILDEYEFANEEIGLRELVELANHVGDNYDKERFDIDAFMQDNSYYGGFYMVPIEGKMTIKVYNGFAKITELFIGDELVLKLK